MAVDQFFFSTKRVDFIHFNQLTNPLSSAEATSEEGMVRVCQASFIDRWLTDFDFGPFPYFEHLYHMMEK